MLSKYWHTQHRNDMLIIGFLIASKFKPGNSSLRQRLLKWMTQVQGSSDQHVNAGPGELSTYIYIYYFIWRKHENMSPCIGSRVNTNYEWITRVPTDKVWKISMIFQWYFKTKVPNFHDNYERFKTEKHRTTYYTWSSHTSYDHWPLLILTSQIYPIGHREYETHGVASQISLIPKLTHYKTDTQKYHVQTLKLSFHISNGGL